MFLAGTSCSSSILERGGESSSSFAFKETGTNISASASTQNMHFQNHIINDLWGILSCDFTDTFWGLILHIVKSGIICLLEDLCDRNRTLVRVSVIVGG